MISTQPIFFLVAAIGLCGFELAAGITTLFAVDTTLYSIIVRGIAATLAGLLIIKFASRSFSAATTAFLTFAAFWVIYGLRVLYATTSDTEDLRFPGWYYWIWAFGACAIPMFGLAVYPTTRLDWGSIFRNTYALVVLGGVIVFLGGSSIDVSSAGDLVDTGRFQLPTLNPILVGQLGVTLMLMSLWGLLVSTEPPRGRFWHPVMVGVLAFGAVLLLFSNSRGPIVSLLCVVTIVALTVRTRRVLLALSAFALVGLGIKPLMEAIEYQFGYTTFSRLFGQNQFTEISTLYRVDSITAAWNSFLESPIVGSGLEESVFGGYPHNVIIEAFMATGIIGGSLLALGFLTLCVFSVRLISSRATSSWVALLFLQYLIAGQLSGSIYSNNYLWVTVGLLLSVQRGSLRRQPYAPRVESRRARGTPGAGSLQANLRS